MPPRLSLLFIVSALLLSSLSAQTGTASPPEKQLSEAVSTALGQLRPLIDAKNNPAALSLLNGLLPTAPNPSYDLAVLSQIKAQVLLAENHYPEAIAPLETALSLGERYNFFDRRSLLETTYLLSQINFQLAVADTDRVRQRAHYDQAEHYIQLWQQHAPAPTAEAQRFAASIFYNDGTSTLDHSALDLAKIKRAQAEAEKSLYLDPTPNEQTYVLLLASAQQLGQTEDAADLLELLVRLKPSSASYWQELAGSYLNLSADTTNPAEARRYTLRALLSLERAQSQGLLLAPRDNFSIVVLYIDLQRFDHAIALLDSGLKDGGIENTIENWKLLASVQQQSGDTPRSIATYENAIHRFPQDGRLEYALAQLLYSLDRPAEAYPHLEKAVAEGHLEKPGQACLFLACVAYELKRFPDALKWAGTAGTFSDVKKDDIDRLVLAVKEAQAERDSAKITSL